MKIIILIILISAHAYSQQEIPNIPLKIYNGISESIGWQDLPVAIYMINEGSIFAKDNTKLISIPAFGFDRSFQSGIGKNGRESIGGMDQNTIPGIIMYSRTAITIAMDIISPQDVSSDDYKRIFLFYKTMVYTHTLTEISKNVIDRPRPDNSDYRSFFSGHTAVTFAAANFLFREIDDYVDSKMDGSNKLESMGLKAVSFAVLFGWAGYVAYSRIYDNKHYLSDVLLGAAAGTLISNLVFDSYLNDRDSIINYFSLGMVNNNPSLSFNFNF